MEQIFYYSWNPRTIYVYTSLYNSDKFISYIWYGAEYAQIITI